MELNIRIRREENSTGDNKSGWANSTLAEDKDSGINPERGGDGGDPGSVSRLWETQNKLANASIADKSASENTSSTMIQGGKPLQFWHLNKRSFTSAGWEKEWRESVAHRRSTMISLVTGAGVGMRLESSRL